MKKIVSAVALTALAGSLFAADLTVKSEIKYQPVVARWDLGKDANLSTYGTQAVTNDATSIQLKEGNVTVFGKLDMKSSGISLNNAYAKLAWGAANITAGIFESRFTNRVTTDQNDLSLIEQNYAVPAWQSNSNATATTKNDVTKWGTQTVPGSKKLGINPNMPLSLKFTAGTDDVGKWATDKTYSKAGIDADNATSFQGTKVNGFVFDYTIADPLPGKLLLKAVAKTNAASWEGVNDDATKATINNSAYTLETAFTHDMGTADFIVNLDGDNIGSWGAYLRATAVDGLNAVIGFTYAWDKQRSTTAAKENVVSAITVASKAISASKVTEANAKGIKYYKVADGAELTSVTKGDVYYTITNSDETSSARDYKAWAIDARVRYAITDALAAGIYANLTHIDYKLADKKVLDGINALDVVLNVNYKLNDLAKFFVEGEYVAKSLSNQKAKSDNSNALVAIGSKYGDTDIVAQAGVILTPAKGATITTAVRGVFAGVGAGTENDVKYGERSGTTIAIPVSFKCSL